MTASIRKKSDSWRDRFFPPRRYAHAAVFERVLGTTLEFQCVAASAGECEKAETRGLEEIDRLRSIFDAYDSTSEFRRWQNTLNEDVPVSCELAAVLDAALSWGTLTGGDFQPATEAFTRIWREHEAAQTEVDQTQLEAVVQQIAQALWSVDAQRCRARRLVDLPITLNSIAKGFIIDRAAEGAAETAETYNVLVNIGGDLRHVGDSPVNIDIVNPFEAADNAKAACTVRFANMGLATSGNYRRGFQIKGRWYSHVLNPHTGWPVERIVSASVLAPDATTADVLATVCSVLPPSKALALADLQETVGLLLIEADGTPHSNDFWRRHVVAPS